MNRTDTHHLFISQPKYRDEASRSWWLEETSRDAFQAAAIRERLRMSRSREAKGVNPCYIVGHAGRSK